MKSIYIYILFSYSCKRGDKLERIRLDINHNPNLCSEKEIFFLFLSVTFREDVTLASSDVIQDKYDISHSSVALPFLFYLPLFPFHTPIHLPFPLRPSLSVPPPSSCTPSPSCRSATGGQSKRV